MKLRLDQINLGNPYWVMACVFVVTLMGVSILSGLLPVTVQSLMLSSVLQAVIVFGGTSLLMILMMPRLVGFRLKSALPLLYALLIMVAATPALNAVIEWNENMTLPASWSAVENSIRAMEDMAQQTTDLMLSGDSVGALLEQILVVGLITGFFEELLFRGALQGTMVRRGMNIHVAVWLSAFIFSVLHFQFFGFVPRLLLGALFGYMYLYSGTIWMSATAHAFNNSVVVVTTWLMHRGIYNAEESLDPLINQPWMIALSAALVIAVWVLVWLNSKRNKLLPA